MNNHPLKVKMSIEDKLNEPVSRRDFLKKTIKLAGAVSLATILPSFLAGCIEDGGKNNNLPSTGPSVAIFKAYRNGDSTISINASLIDRSHNITSAKYEVYQDGNLEQSEDIPIDARKKEYKGVTYHLVDMYIDIKSFDFRDKDYVINILVKNSAGKTTKISFDDNILNWAYEDEPLYIENFCARENDDKNSQNAFISVTDEIPEENIYHGYLNSTYQLYLKDKLLTEETNPYPFFKSLEKLDVGKAYDLVLSLDGEDDDGVLGKVNGKLTVTFTPEDLC